LTSPFIEHNTPSITGNQTRVKIKINDLRRKKEKKKEGRTKEQKKEKKKEKKSN
jgi:hypothetical protein